MSIAVGGGRWLNPDECAAIAACSKMIRNGFSANGRPAPAWIENLLAELRETTLAAYQNQATSENTSELLPELGGSASVAEECVWLPTKVVAGRLGISDRAVRYHAESGRLIGQKRGTGRGTWVITEQSVIAYQDGASNGLSTHRDSPRRGNRPRRDS